MTTGLTRRQWLSTSAAASAVLATSTEAGAKARPPDEAEPFGYCLNTSTLSGHKLPITAIADLIAKVGYRGIEPWTRELDAHAQGGGSLDDLGKRFRDLNLSVEDVIGFFEWAVDDEGRRKAALEECRRCLAMSQAIGAKRLAAPPLGATDRDDIDPRRLAERYRALLDLAEPFGVVPIVEVWGMSKTLGRLGSAAQVAIDADHPKAAILPDVFHMYKGQSGFRGIRLLRGESIGIFHLNDYPESPARETIDDSGRIFPGDGVAPLSTLFQDLRAIGYQGMLSLELFNREYWKRDAESVARDGLNKMRAAVRKAFA